MTASPAPKPKPAQSAWHRRVIDPIAAQMIQGITPEKLALTIAVGSALALFPIYGTTTLLCLFVGIALRLNQPTIQLVNIACAVPHFAAIYGFFRLGALIFGIPHHPGGFKAMVGLMVGSMRTLWTDPSDSIDRLSLFFEKFGMDAVRAIVAWAIVAPLWIPVIYFFSRAILREVLRRRAEAAAAVAANHPVP